MKQGIQNRITILATSAIMILLIVNTNIAIAGVSEGIELCIRVIIPSLFPFFVVTSLLNGSIIGHQIPYFHYLTNKLNFPKFGDSILLLGLTGGYPVGAQLIAQSYHSKQLSKQSSRILLGYCNNAGPAFIFGIAYALFSSKPLAFAIWFIHIFSALLTGFLLPRPQAESIQWKSSNGMSVTNSLKQSIQLCATTCGWIILFKIVLSYIQKFFIHSSSSTFAVIISGILEISNGCVRLAEIPSVSIKFILCNLFISFGGICVMLQTASAAEGLGLGLYVPGKIIQTGITTMIAVLFAYLFFPQDQIPIATSLSLLSLCLISIFITVRCIKIDMEIPRKIVYNRGN